MTVPLPGHLISCRAYVPIWHLTISFTISFIAPAPCNVLKFQISILISLILLPCLGRLHSVWLFQGHRLGFLRVGFFTSDMLGQSTMFITPGKGWPSYTSKHWPTFVAFYDPHGLHWDYYFPHSPHGVSHTLSSLKFLINCHPMHWMLLIVADQMPWYKCSKHSKIPLVKYIPQTLLNKGH